MSSKEKELEEILDDHMPEWKKDSSRRQWHMLSRFITWKEMEEYQFTKKEAIIGLLAIGLAIFALVGGMYWTFADEINVGKKMERAWNEVYRKKVLATVSKIDATRVDTIELKKKLSGVISTQGKLERGQQDLRDMLFILGKSQGMDLEQRLLIFRAGN